MRQEKPGQGRHHVAIETSHRDPRVRAQAAARHEHRHEGRRPGRRLRALARAHRGLARALRPAEDRRVVEAAVPPEARRARRHCTRRRLLTSTRRRRCPTSLCPISRAGIARGPPEDALDVDAPGTSAWLATGCARCQCAPGQRRSGARSGTRPRDSFGLDYFRKLERFRASIATRWSSNSPDTNTRRDSCRRHDSLQPIAVLSDRDQPFGTRPTSRTAPSLRAALGERRARTPRCVDSFSRRRDESLCATIGRPFGPHP